MVYEIDESCLTALKTNDSNSIAFLEQLALDRRKCKNIIVAKRQVFEELSKMTCFSNVTRKLYSIMENRASEQKMILKSTKRYCRLVAQNQGNTIIYKNQKEIIILEICNNTLKDFTEKTLMLAENEDDISFYKMLGQFYVRESKIGKIKIDFEPRNGGGSTTYGVLQRIIEEKNRMCLCIVDSDKKYGNAEPRETMQKVKEIANRNMQDYFEVILLDVHEIENLIPINVLEQIIKKLNISKQGIDFMRFLVREDCSLESPVFYFDLKKGIPLKAYFLEEDADKERERKYRKLSAYRKYWRLYIEKFGVKIEDKNDYIIEGICDKTLRHALDYFNDIKKQEKLESFEIEPYLKNSWMEIGEKVYCWGCVGGRIAI